MIQSKKELREWLLYEKKRYNIPKGIRYFLKSIVASEQIIIWRFQKRLRKTEYYKNIGNLICYFFSLICLNRMRNKYGLHIALNVFDKGLHIMHLGSILTNDRVKVGENCAIHINVSIVAQGVTDAVPQIGNNVVLGVGATVLGDIILADGIAVGANAVVNKSFLEEDIAIAGVPALKVSNNGKKNWNRKD